MNAVLSVENITASGRVLLYIWIGHSVLRTMREKAGYSEDGK